MKWVLIVAVLVMAMLLGSNLPPDQHKAVAQLAVSCGLGAFFIVFYGSILYFFGTIGLGIFRWAKKQ